MKIGYARLFDLAVSHAYQDTLENRDFIVRPTADTVALLARFNLLFKTTATGCTVLYELDPAGAGTEPLKSLEPDLTFRFALLARHSQVLQISALPLDQAPFYRVHNGHANIVNGVNYLNDPAAGNEFVSAADRLDLLPLQFNYEYTTAAASAKLELVAADGTLTRSETLASAGGKVRTFLDLTSDAPGAYTLNLDGVTQKAFYADDALLRMRAFGVAEISLSASVPADYRLLDADGSPHFRSFALRFANRSVTWRYFVVPRSDADLGVANLLVEDGSARYGFPPAGAAAVLRTGEPAVVFVSTGPIPLQRLPIKNLQLKKRVNGGGTVELMADLPNPRLDSLGFDPAIPQVFSDIFVYV